MSAQVYGYANSKRIADIQTSQASRAVIHLIGWDDLTKDDYDSDGWYQMGCNEQAVKKADARLSVSYDEQSESFRKEYSEADFNTAREFICRCALVGAHISYSH